MDDPTSGIGDFTTFLGQLDELANTVIDALCSAAPDTIPWPSADERFKDLDEVSSDEIDALVREKILAGDWAWIRAAMLAVEPEEEDDEEEDEDSA